MKFTTSLKAILFLALQLTPASFVAAGGHGQTSEKDTIEPPNSKVHVLTFSNFHRFVNSHADDLILMEFYAPWCHHCQMLAPQYRQAALELANADLPRKVVLAKYDDSEDFNRNLRAGAPDMYNFTSYPSLYVLDDGEHERYGGGREADDIVLHMSAMAKGLNPYEEERKSKPGLYKDKPEYAGYVQDLMDEWDFNHTIAASPNNAIRIVEFYSDRCPFCKSLSPEVVKAAKILKETFKGEVEVHAVNSRIYHFVAEDWGITGYPWVCAFYNGEKVDDMAGLGGYESIVNWATKKHEAHFIPNNSKEVKKGPYPTLTPEQGEIAKKVRIAILEAEEKGEERPTEEALAAIAAEAAAEAAAAAAAAGGDKPAVVDEVKAVAVVTDSEGTVITSDKEKGAVWRAKLGQNTWFLLHTMAAKYPENPTNEDKIGMMNTIAGIGQLYPCKMCRNHLRDKLGNPKIGVPDVSSREGLSKWMCNLHNDVNKDLNKPMHDCTPFSLDLIYLKDCGECEHGGKKEKDDGSLSVWDRELFAEGAEYYQAVVKSETKAWEARELKKIWDAAIVFGLTTEDDVKSMRGKIMSGERDQSFYMNIWGQRIEEAKKKL